MVPTLSFKLLPNRNSDVVGISLVRVSSFGSKILDKYYLVMFSYTIFAITWKVKNFMQILMTRNNWSLSPLTETSLLFLKFIRLFVTSQMANAPLRTAPGLFSLVSLYYDPEHSFIFAKSLFYIFSRVSQNSCGVSYTFSFCFWISQKR